MNSCLFDLRLLQRLTSPFCSLVVAGLALAFITTVIATPAVAADEQPLKILLLDYHAPTEHDVLQSHLCVEPCTRERGCPAEWVAQGADFFNESMMVFRPAYLGRGARFMVNAYKNKGIDLVSISGHHASGFSGQFGRGSFATEDLADDVAGVEGADDFFTAPSMVMLHGCWTDVKSGFDGDPVEYIRHIIEDTTVRAGESERLQAAVQQIAGDEQAYRDLFPNACILGYSGTQIPGGRLEIYGQIHHMLVGMSGFDGRDQATSKFDFKGVYRDREVAQAINRQVEAECGNVGWPCNLCRQDADTYQPLLDALTATLKRERYRLSQGLTRPETKAKRLERAYESASYYGNTSWSCSAATPGTPPVYPQPIDRSPFAELFFDLLRIDLGSIEGDVRDRFEAELIHLLGNTNLSADTRERLLAKLDNDEGRTWRRGFVRDTLSQVSTFRQRDFFDFLSQVGCTSCFEEVLQPTTQRVMRENAASQLTPRLGREIYEQALNDPSARVRRLAASRLESTLGMDLVRKAANDQNEKVRREVEQRFGAKLR